MMKRWWIKEGADMKRWKPAVMANNNGRYASQGAPTFDTLAELGCYIIIKNYYRRREGKAPYTFAVDLESKGKKDCFPVFFSEPTFPPRRVDKAMLDEAKRHDYPWVRTVHKTLWDDRRSILQADEKKGKNRCPRAYDAFSGYILGGKEYYAKCNLYPIT